MEFLGIATQIELAKRMNITKNQLSALLADSYCPVKASVKNIADALMVPIDEIISVDALPIERQVVTEPDQKQVTAIELFAGAGGLALGMEKGGIKTVEFVEFDRICCDTLKKNRPDWNVICEDIHQVD